MIIFGRTLYLLIQRREFYQYVYLILWTYGDLEYPCSMPSYEASHEFDKRGHRPHQPQAMPGPGPQHRGRYGGPTGNNSRFNNRVPRHGGAGPDTRHQGLKPPAGPAGHSGYGPSSQTRPQVGPPHHSHPHVSLPQQPLPNAPAVFPGPVGYHGELPIGPGLVSNMPPAPLYGANVV